MSSFYFKVTFCLRKQWIFFLLFQSCESLKLKDFVVENCIETWICIWRLYMRHLKRKSNRINLTMTLVLKPLHVCGYVFLMKKYMCSLYYLEKSFLKSKLTGVTLDRVNAWRSSVLLSVTAWGSFMCFYRPFGHSLVRTWDSFIVFLHILCLRF